MLVAAAVLPHPPLLLPALAGRAVSDLDALRHACTVAIGRVMQSAPDILLVVGGANEGGTFEAGAVGSLSRFGLDVAVRLPGILVGESRAPTVDISQQELPLALEVAAYLLADHPVDIAVRGHAVDYHTSSTKAQHAGAELAHSFPRVALLAMGDGSACLDVKAPGYVVDGAAEWQQHVDAVFAAADFNAVGQLTEAEADRFWAAGRAAWQVLAGAAMSEPAHEVQEGGSSQWAPVVHYAGAPYGVQYLVVSFRRTDKE